MKIKLWYFDPKAGNESYEKSLVCETLLSFPNEGIKFMHEFACEVSVKADINDIPRDLVYKAELLDDNDNILYQREGLPLNVTYIKM